MLMLILHKFNVCDKLCLYKAGVKVSVSVITLCFLLKNVSFPPPCTDKASLMRLVNIILLELCIRYSQLCQSHYKVCGRLPE